MVISLIGVVLSLIFLVVFAYRGHSVVVVGPAATLIAVLFAREPVMGTYTQIFMPALAGGSLGSISRSSSSARSLATS